MGFRSAGSRLTFIFTMLILFSAHFALAQDNKALIENLKAEDPEARIDAVMALGEAKAGEAAGALIELAGTEADPEVRYYAARALGMIGAADALPLLEKLALDDAELSMRKMKRKGRTNVSSGAIIALADIGQPAETALIELLANPSAVVRARVAQQAHRVKTDAVFKALAANADDPDPRLRIFTHRALFRMDKEKAGPYLIAALKDENAHIRRQAAGLLKSLSPSTAVAPLLEAMNDPDRDVRREAMSGLAGMKAQEAVPRFIALMDDPATYTDAGSSLAEIDPKRAVEALKPALLGENMDDLGMAFQVLFQIDDPAADDVLSAMLQSKNPLARSLAAGRLSQTRPAEMLPVLLSAFKSGSWYDKSITFDALDDVYLKHLDDPAFRELLPQILATLEDEDENMRCGGAITALLWLHELTREDYEALPKEIRDRITPYLFDETRVEDVTPASVVDARKILLEDGPLLSRLSAAALMQKWGSPYCAVVLSEGTLVRQPEVQAGCILLLAEGTDRDVVWPGVNKILYHLAGSPNEYVRFMSILALTSLMEDRPKETVEVNLAALQFDYPAFQEDAAEALGKSESSQAVPALVQALSAPYAKVRQAAAEALGKIGDASAIPALSKAMTDRYAGVGEAARNAAEQIRYAPTRELDQQAADLLQLIAQAQELYLKDKGAYAGNLTALYQNTPLVVPEAIEARILEGNDKAWRATARHKCGAREFIYDSAMGGLVPSQ